MEEESQLSFSDLLDLLFSEESIPIQRLYRLSDLDNKQSATFRQRWSAAADERRQQIARHLADISEDNFVVDFSPIFAFMLSDTYAPVRSAALDGLWDCDDEQVVEPILELLANDRVIAVRAAAARALAHFLMMAEWGQLPGKKLPLIFDALREAYLDPEAPLPVKCAALEAMGPLSHPRVRDFIEESFEGSVPELQRSALFAMGTSADSRWLPILLDEMESPYVEMRAEAARAAGGIGAGESVAMLSELLYDEDEDVAKAAIVSLAQIGGAEADRALEDLLADSTLSHLYETVEEAQEETIWTDREHELFPWSDSDFEDDLDMDDTPE